MDNFQMLLSDGWLALKRVICRSPNPDSVLADAGNQGIVDQARQTLNKPNWPPAAQRDDRPIPVRNRLTIMLGNFRESWPVDRRMRLRRQAAVNIADDKIVLSSCSKRHDWRHSKKLGGGESSMVMRNGIDVETTHKR